MSTADLKLTKKKKKALAFHSRIKNQTNGNPSQNETENLPIFALENEGDSNEDRSAPKDGWLEAANDSVEFRGKNKARMDRMAELAITQATRCKRKRELDGVSEDDELRKKVKQDKSKEKERFILFVGNLRFSTTVDAVEEHFLTCDPPPSVRLLTPKASTTGKQPTKSKGCAFLEFSNRKALQQALKLHHSKLDGRMINVELTAGGGGKSEARLKKLRERNKHLHNQRDNRAKGTIKNKEESDAVEPQESQRYSATSGVGQALKKKRTWTVGDVAEEKKARSQRRLLMKNQATGVNAIPIG